MQCSQAARRFFSLFHPRPDPFKAASSEEQDLKTASLASASYGVKHITFYQRGRHLRKDRYWDFTRQEWMAKNQMWWTLKQVNHQHVPNPKASENSSQTNDVDRRAKI